MKLFLSIVLILALFNIIPAITAEELEKKEVKKVEAETSPEVAKEEVKSADVEVVEISMCKSVENKACIDNAATFEKGITKLFCYSKIKLGQDLATNINHVWYYNGNKMAEVVLDIKGPQFSTWSSKSILNEWLGNWRVDVTNSTGEVIRTINFKIE